MWIYALSSALIIQHSWISQDIIIPVILFILLVIKTLLPLLVKFLLFYTFAALLTLYRTSLLNLLEDWLIPVIILLLGGKLLLFIVYTLLPFIASTFFLFSFFFLPIIFFIHSNFPITWQKISIGYRNGVFFPDREYWKDCWVDITNVPFKEFPYYAILTGCLAIYCFTWLFWLAVLLVVLLILFFTLSYILGCIKIEGYAENSIDGWVIIIVMGIMKGLNMVVQTIAFVINKFTESKWIVYLNSANYIIRSSKIMSLICLIAFIILTFKFLSVFIVMIIFLFWPRIETPGLVCAPEPENEYTEKNIILTSIVITTVVMVVIGVVVSNIFASIIGLPVYLALIIGGGLQFIKSLAFYISNEFKFDITKYNETLQQKSFLEKARGMLTFGSVENWEGLTSNTSSNFEGVFTDLAVIVSQSIGSVQNWEGLTNFPSPNFPTNNLSILPQIIFPPSVGSPVIYTNLNSLNSTLFNPNSFNTASLSVKHFSTCNIQISVVFSEEIEFIPFVDTSQLKECRASILTVIDEWGPTDPLVIWIKENALSLLTEPNGFTNITTNSLSITALDKGIQLSNNLINTNHSQDSGVYLVSSGNNLYVGSAINILNRWVNRYASGSEPWFERINISEFKYTEICNTPYYAPIFYMTRPYVVNENSKYYNLLLRTLTTYHVRLVEQAVISYINPSLNSKIIVDVSPFTLDTTIGRQITFMATDTAFTMDCVSLTEAAFVTGIVNYKITDSINNHSPIYSPKYDDFLVFWETTPITTVVPTPVSINTPSVSVPNKVNFMAVSIEEIGFNVELYQIPINELWVFNPNGDVVAVFQFAIEAIKAYGISRRTIFVHKNRNFISIPGLPTPILFARNPHWDYNPTQQLVVENFITGQAYLYPSLRSTCHTLGISKNVDNIKACIDSERTIGHFRVCSLENAPYIPTEYGPKVLITKDLSPQAYVVDTFKPVTVHAFKSRGLAVIFVSNNKHYRNSPNHLFKPYGDNGVLYQERYYLYTKGNLPAKYKNLVGKTITKHIQPTNDD